MSSAHDGNALVSCSTAFTESFAHASSSATVAVHAPAGLPHFVVVSAGAATHASYVILQATRNAASVPAPLKAAAKKALTRQVKSAGRPAKKAQAEPEEGRKLRFSAKGLKTHREKLGLSAAEYGQLAEVSSQSIYNWEAGKTVPRQAQVQALAGLRGIGKREAAKRLEAAGGE